MQKRISTSIGAMGFAIRSTSKIKIPFWGKNQAILNFAESFEFEALKKSLSIFAQNFADFALKIKIQPKK